MREEFETLRESLQNSNIFVSENLQQQPPMSASSERKSFQPIEQEVNSNSSRRKVLLAAKLEVNH